MSMTQNPAAASRQQLVEVSSIPGYFANKTGGETTADVTKVWDGGSTRAENMPGPASTANVVVARPYRPLTHGPIIKRLEGRVGRETMTVSIYDTDPDLGPVGEPTVYADALLVRVTRPDHDAGSSDPGTFELEFAVNEPA